MRLEKIYNYFSTHAWVTQGIKGGARVGATVLHGNGGVTIVPIPFRFIIGHGLWSWRGCRGGQVKATGKAKQREEAYEAMCERKDRRGNSRRIIRRHHRGENFK